MTRLSRELRRGHTVILDGGTGTELERRGAAMHGDTWCAMATLTHPALLRDIHSDYIRAGASVITTNTFSTNRNLLEPSGLAAEFEPLNRLAVALAREAREQCDAQDRVVVAGSMSHQIPVVPGADQRDQNAVPDPATASANFREMAELLGESGVDLILLEMMSDPQLANPAIEAALATGLPVWVGFSVRADAEQRPVSYACPSLSAADMLDRVELEGVELIGMMHSNVHLIDAMLPLLRDRWTGPFMAYPDSGYFKMPHWHFVDIIEPAELVARSLQWRASGVQVLGGCCGLGVSHIAALAQAHATPMPT
jgi:S-methylmethionine-dependent homocysteine/selenocysteine methylase